MNVLQACFFYYFLIFIVFIFVSCAVMPKMNHAKNESCHLKNLLGYYSVIHKCWNAGHNAVFAVIHFVCLHLKLPYESCAHIIATMIGHTCELVDLSLYVQLLSMIYLAL